ncbi:MAG: cytochrome b N-terminal domain-containing protein [Anaerolineales bacterium]|nr:cytochrome b N-terminal domain-containing protein [Anaerolineales bacterium]
MKANMSSLQSTQRGWFSEWLVERTGWKGLTYPVPAHANTIWYLLGGISFVGFLILFVTGIYMAQFYNPQPADAQQSVVYLITGVPLGDLIRSIHYWTAQIVTLTVILHFLRVLVTAAYKKPRELNWFIGIGLLLVTLGAVYTGSVLKYDQEGLEALQHAKETGELMGALGAFFTSEFSRSVSLLTRFFTVHISILPLAFAALIGVHIYLINQHGISPNATVDATARKTKGEGESRFDVHLRSMIGYGLILLSIVVLLALLLPAPIGQPGVPGVEVTKPWWMFVWLFPAEARMGTLALIVVPAILGTLLVLVPILDRSPFLSPLKRKGILILAGIILLIMIISGVVAALQPVTGHLG